MSPSSFVSRATSLLPFSSQSGGKPPHSKSRFSPFAPGVVTRDSGFGTRVSGPIPDSRTPIPVLIRPLALLAVHS